MFGLNEYILYRTSSRSLTRDLVCNLAHVGVAIVLASGTNAMNFDSFRSCGPPVHQREALYSHSNGPFISQSHSPLCLFLCLCWNLHSTSWLYSLGGSIQILDSIVEVEVEVTNDDRSGDSNRLNLYWTCQVSAPEHSQKISGLLSR